jgi:hypothetical protein
MVLKKKYIRLICGFLVYILCAMPFSTALAAELPAGQNPLVYAPVIVFPSQTLLTSTAAPTVVLKAASGSSVSVMEGLSVVGTGTVGDVNANADSVTIQLSPLSKGIHRLTALASVNGIFSAPAKLPLIVVDDRTTFDISSAVEFGEHLNISEWNGLLEAIAPRFFAPPASFGILPGTAVGTVKALTSPDRQFYVKVSDRPIETPSLLSAVPEGAISYMSGTNISGADTETNKYLGIYQTLSGRISGFSQHILQPEDISVTVEGIVKEATSSDLGINGITLRFRAGQDNKNGPVEGTAVTNSDGSYSMILAPGRYTVEMNGTGYATTFKNADLVGGMSSGNNLVIIPRPQGEETRIALFWGTQPRDLDSHLIGPSPIGGSFHIYYGAKTFDIGEVRYASMDLDDTNGEGPETTTTATLLQEVPGTYRFFVHNFSNETDLSASDARVEVYRGASASSVQTYHIPTSAVGRFWQVFDLVIDNNRGISFVDQNRLVNAVPAIGLQSLSVNAAGSVKINVDNYDPGSGIGNSTSDLTMDDFMVSADLYKASAGHAPVTLNNLAFDPANGNFTFNPIPAIDEQQQLTLKVERKASSQRLIGNAVTATIDIAPITTATTITGISAALGSITVTLADNAVGSQLGLADFSVTASVYDTVTGSVYTQGLTNMGYNPSNRTITFDPLDLLLNTQLHFTVTNAPDSLLLLPSSANTIYALPDLLVSYVKPYRRLEYLIPSG